MMTLKAYLDGASIMTDERATNILYLGTTGLTLVQNIMKLKYTTRQLMYDKTDEGLTNDEIIALVQNDTLTAFEMHDYNWTKKYTTITATYDALTTQNLSESKTDTNSGQDITAENGTNTGTISNTKNQTVSKITYDNATMTATDSSIDTDATTNNLADSNTTTTTYGHVLNSSRTLTGRDNIPAQDLILKEREVAEYNFYEMIADEITDFICTTIYINFKDAEGSDTI